MALISCPECTTEVSSSAFKCPKCGVQLLKPTRSFFGKLIKWGFILFNIFMAWVLISGMNAASKIVESSSGASQAGAAIGTGLGAAMIIGLWGFGAIILGLFVLFTRPKS